ncbi:unnamed protein product, partial [Symbiodinium sp. KB8]
MAAEGDGKVAEGREELAGAKGGVTSLMDGFDSFETKMKHSTRQRREKDEHRLKKIRETVGQLERSVTVERSQRQEMTKSLQTVRG